MAFKPQSSANAPTGESNYAKVDWNAINKQVKAGNRPARISLIVDLGVQSRDNFEEEYNENLAKHIKALDSQGAELKEVDGKTFISIPQSDQPQIAVFADLTSDLVDFGGELGKQPYRLSLNGSDYGEIRGVGFTGCYSYDNKGQIQKDKGFTFHSTSLLTKLAKATKQEQIISGSGKDNMDVEQLLNQPFLAQVVKSEKGDKTYLNYKACSPLGYVPSDPSDPDSEEVLQTVRPLVSPPLTITFDNVTPETVKWLRGDVVKKIKQATNYAGSKMQEVLEGNTSSNASNNASGEATAGDNTEGNDTPQGGEVKAPKATVKKSKPTPVVVDDFDDDVPF